MDTSDVTNRPVTVDTLGRRVMPRHFRPLSEKRRIAQEAMQPGVSVAEIARRYGINANLVFTWRRMEQQGLLGTRVRRGSAAMVAVQVTPAMDSAPRLDPPPRSSTPGTVRIEFADGVQLHVSGAGDERVLERIIRLLRG